MHGCPFLSGGLLEATGMPDTEVWSFGLGSNGQLGLGDRLDRSATMFFLHIAPDFMQNTIEVLIRVVDNVFVICVKLLICLA